MMLVGMFIPYQSILIPLVKFLQLVNLYGTIPGLVLVHVVYGIPITTLIFRNFYISIPKEIVEAAAIDGFTHSPLAFFNVTRPIFTFTSERSA